MDVPEETLHAVTEALLVSKRVASQATNSFMKWLPMLVIILMVVTCVLTREPEPPSSKEKADAMVHANLIPSSTFLL
jgi:hypothetical protein